MKEFRRFSEKSDAYSFGVFLIELVSGREATDSASSDSSQNLVEWVFSSVSLQFCDCYCCGKHYNPLHQINYYDLIVTTIY